MLIRIYVGYDDRESIAYHTFCQSVLEKSSEPVCFIPMAKNTLYGFDGQRDGSNAFIYSRFLIPAMCDYSGFAIWADGDMVCNADIAELWAMRDPTKGAQVVKHDYLTKHPVKYLGAPNDNYPRKNWSSLILWNCAHYPNRKLTREYVEKATGAELHRFTWLEDGRIGELPKTWNWLVGEYPRNDNAKLLHYTIGSPCFDAFARCDGAYLWHQAKKRMIKVDQPK